MGTRSFTKTPGSPPTADTGDGGTMILFGDDTPEWVRLPDNLGGQRVPVTRVVMGPCVHPDCGPHRTFVTSATAPRDGVIASIECTTRNQFLWVRVDA